MRRAEAKLTCGFSILMILVGCGGSSSKAKKVDAGAGDAAAQTGSGSNQQGTSGTGGRSSTGTGSGGSTIGLVGSGGSGGGGETSGGSGGKSSEHDAGSMDASVQDAGAQDSGAHDAGGQHDSGMHDSGMHDSGPTCVVGEGCTLNSGDDGIYDSACVCGACPSTDAAGDSVCVTAYGAGNLCLTSGSSRTCAAASCRSTTGTPAPGCSEGQICTTDGQCVACTASADCTAAGAYGSGYVCDQGVCATGECVTSNDCHMLGGSKDGQLCTSSHTCGACATDDDCTNDAWYGSGAVSQTLCDASMHVCVSNLCSMASSPASCTGSRLCCSSVCLADTAFRSTAGAGKSCCVDADCTGTGAPNCDGHACSTCSSVTENLGTMTYDFVVDPANTSDVGTSGTASPSSCRFKTLTHALQYVSIFNGVTASTPARIFVYGDISSTTGETFPLVIPANVNVIGQSQGGSGSIKVLVPTGQIAFRMNGSASALSNLGIDGADNSSTSTRYSQGVVIGAAPGGSAPTGVALDHVSIQHSLGDGITIGGQGGNNLSGASVTLGPGVNVSGAGFTSTTAGATVRSNGVTMAGTAAVTIVGGSGADQSAFDGNSQHGIAVHAQASITINVALDLSAPTSMAYDASPVVADDNQAAGLAVLQNPTGAATNTTPWTTMATSHVTGLVCLNTRSGNGIRIEGGSKVVLRGSVVYGSSGDGVLVPTASQLGGSITTADRNFVGGIDLGADVSTNAGHNVLQVPGVAFNGTAPHGQNPNQGAGICLGIAPAASNGQTLSALGNWFVLSGTNAETDCSAAAANTAIVQRNSCRSVQSTATRLGIPTSVGVTGAVGGTNANHIDVSNCAGQ